MDSAGSHSERFIDQPSSAQENDPAPCEQISDCYLSTPPEQPQQMASGVTMPLPPLPSLAQATVPDMPAPEATQPPAASGSASVFRINQGWLAALQDLNWRRVRALLLVLVVGVGLGLLLLIPAVHQSPPAVHLPAHGNPHVHIAVPQKPLWASIVLVVSIVAPLLSLAIGLLALPGLLWRAVWLRRQRDLHLAIGRQGLLFFLPGRAGCWLLLPWGHITGMTAVTSPALSARSERLRTVLWRRWARLRRRFRRGRRLGMPSALDNPVRSPFLAHALAASPQQRLRVVCYARLPDSGYSWLFGLAPFTRRIGAATFLLDAGWFAPAISAPGVSLQRVLLSLWAAPLARAERPVLPLPRSRGAVLLNTPAPAQDTEPEARRVDGAAWAALPLLPALSVMLAALTLSARQPLAAGAALDLATLVVLTLGLSLLLAGARWPTRGRVFASGAFALALAGILNAVYGLVALLQAWPWAIQIAPGVPFFFLEALAGLLLLFGGSALGLEGSGRPGLRSLLPSGAPVRPHSTELVVAVGLLTLGAARILEDIDLAALNSGAATLHWLRYTLAEPLLPLAIIGLSYFVLLAGPTLQNLFRALQAIYGLVLALVVPAAFIFVYRAGGGAGLLPKTWLPLLIVEFICGLLVVVFAVLPRQQPPPY